MEEIPEQILDMATDKMVPNPAYKKPEPEGESEESDNEETEEEEITDTNAESETEEETEESEDEESETDESDETTEEEAEDEAEETDESDEEEEDAATELSPDAFIESVYSEKYGIKTQAELETVIENALDLSEEFETLQKEHEALKAEAGKPKFTSEKQQKAFEFLSQYELDHQGEALDTFAKLLSMDIEKTDGKLLMEEAFVHQHPELTRAEAQRKFNKEHDRKYNLKREAFDGDDAAYAEEVEDRKIDMKSDVAKAKEFLKDKKTKYSPKAKEEAPSTPEVVTTSIKKNAEEYVAYAGKQNELVFEHDGEKYSFKLDDAKKKSISNAMEQWVKNPASYDEKGQLRGIKKADEMFNMVVGSLYLKDYLNAIIGQVKNTVNTKRVDEVAKKKVEKRIAPGGGDARKGGDDLDNQAMKLIKSKKAA